MLGLVLLQFSYVMAQKTVYIPYEWRNRTDTLIYAENDPNNRYTWSKSRSKESENVIVFWDKYYGNTDPQKTTGFYHVDIDDLLRKCEAFFELEINQLGFVDPNNSNLNKYKVMVLMNHTTEWTCYGGGYDFQVSALWLNPSTCQPVGHSVAHEIGHSFHYMCYAEASNHGAIGGVQTGFHGAVGNGSVTWEQTAQWQANQSYPELMYDQSIGVFRNSHNYAYTHEWHRYQSYWFFYYLCQYYNDIKTVANVWNYPETRIKDFNEVLMDYKKLSVDDLYRLYFDYACRLATWDLEVCKPYRNPYIGDFNYRCVQVDEKKYQVALSSCPQSTGFNVIPLKVPQAGTEVTTNFTALRYDSELAEGDPAEYLNENTGFTKANTKKYNVINGSYRGFRLGYVALLKDGTRKYYSQDSIYCTGGTEKTESVSFTVPENVSKMWLIVSPALKRYIQHKWDESFNGDDQWPYQVEFDGTDIGSKATVYVSPKIDGRVIADATFTWDVTFPYNGSAYTGASVVVGGSAASTLGTAFQMPVENISGKMQAYSASGPSNGRIMFYAVNTNGSLAASGSTANGYGHWFNAAGTVCPYSNGYIYSEFTPQTMTFYVGQYPGKCPTGNKYTVRQALRYKKNAQETATAYFVFNVTIGNTESVELTKVEYDEETVLGVRNVTLPAASQADGIYNLRGQKMNSAESLPKGIYIVNGKKVSVK